MNSDFILPPYNLRLWRRKTIAPGVRLNHLWEITSGEAALSAHVLCREGEDCHALRRDLEEALTKRFAIKHTTLQVDHASDGFVPVESVKVEESERTDHG
jgi:cobalt-zinc-cadmium efflux system protein